MVCTSGKTGVYSCVSLGGQVFCLVSYGEEAEMACWAISERLENHFKQLN